MTDRANSPAYRMLPLRARRVFAAIERAIGDRTSASMSFTEFQFDHRIGRPSISPSVKLLDHLGLIDIEPGPRLINIFRLSNRWRCIDEVEAVRLAALAREAMTQRRFERRREPKAVKRVGCSVAEQPKPPSRDGGRPRIMQRRVPSLPTMPWQDDGR